MTTRTYSGLLQFETIEDRFAYLSLDGQVGEATFGYERWINQEFYTSREWRHVRTHVIARDLGFDLGVEGYEIRGKLMVHHIVPMTPEDILEGNPMVFDLDNLISCSHKTHQAIHFGDENLLPQQLIERRPGDTFAWSSVRGR
jgi:hypothetical protein